jgi:hypothetical protein
VLSYLPNPVAAAAVTLPTPEVELLLPCIANQMVAAIKASVQGSYWLYQSGKRWVAGVLPGAAADLLLNG